MLMKKNTPSSILIFFTLLLICGLGFLIPSEQILAQSEDSKSVTMEVQPAFEGYFKYSEWLPIYVNVENNGPDLAARVQISIPSSAGTTDYVLPVDLPRGSRKRLATYVVPNNFARQLDVKLLVDDQLLAAQIVLVQPLLPTNYFVGLIAPERDALNNINSVEFSGLKRPVQLVNTTLSDIPEKYEGLRSFDLLVFNNTDTSQLTLEQIYAIETWIRKGGRLVIGGGSGAAKTLSGLPESLVPFQADGNQMLESLSGLESYLGEDTPILVPGPFLVTTGKPSSAYILASQADNALIIERPVGNGHVNFVSLDLSTSPFNAWNGTTQFWQYLIAEGSVYPEWLPQDISLRQQTAGQMPYALSNLPVLDLPSIQSLAILLGLYIIIIGPLNYIILRKAQKLHHAWITIPAITLIFTAGAFGLGYQLHGNNIFVNKIALMELGPQGVAHVNTYIGVFSPGQGTYQVEVDGSGLISPVEFYTDPWSSIGPPPGISTSRVTSITQGNPSYIQGLAIDQWSLQSFLVEGTTVEFGDIESELFLVGDILTGEIRNNSNQMIHDATIITGKQFRSVGDIPPNGMVEVEIDLTTVANAAYGPALSYQLLETQFNQPMSPEASRETEVKRIILDSILDRGGAENPLVSGSPMLLGWIDNVPPEIKIMGAVPSEKATALLYTSLKFNLPESGIVNIPIGMIPGTLTKYTLNGGPCGESGSTSVYINQGTAEFDFHIPIAFKEISVENLKINFYTDVNVPELPNISLQNWETGDWITYVPQLGVNLIPDTKNLIRHDGLIRVRIGQDDQFISGCYFLALGLEGRR